MKSCDGSGKLTSDVAGAGAGLLAPTPLATTREFMYDPAGRMIGSRTNEKDWTTHMVSPGWEVLADMDKHLAPERVYVSPGGMDNQVAMIYDTGAGWKTLFYLRDHLGSVLALATPEGEIVESYEYEPYGLPTIYDDEGEVVASRTSAVGNRFMFTGREWEPDGEFYHYRHRTYSPHEKRFMQRDPIGLAGGWNVYAYCGGDPVNASDPMGLRVFLAKGFLHWGIITYDDAKRLWVRYDFGLGPQNFPLHQLWGPGWTAAAIVHDAAMTPMDTGCGNQGFFAPTGITSGTGAVRAREAPPNADYAWLVEPGETVEQIFNADGTSASLAQQRQLLNWLDSESEAPSFYDLANNNCRHWSTHAVRHAGLSKSYTDAQLVVKPRHVAGWIQSAIPYLLTPIWMW